MGDPLYMKYPDLSLAQHVFTLASPASPSPIKQSSLKKVQDAIQEHKMAPLYHYLAHPQTGKLNGTGESTSHGAQSDPPPLKRTMSIKSTGIIGVLGFQASGDVDLPWDEQLYESLKADNEKELQAIQKEEDEAVEKAGETEVQNAKGKRAEFYTRIGDKDAALAAYEALLEKTGILGSKIDVVLAIIRIGLFFDDKLLVKKNVERCSTLVESGGDWDRRNRLKAYQGLHLLTIRAHNLAAPLLLDSLSTFTSTELCSYSNLVVYAVLAGSISLPRRDFRSKVVDAPEVRAILGSDSSSTSFNESSSMDVDGDTDSAKKATATPTPVVNLTTLGSSSSTGHEEPQLDFSPLAQMIGSLYQGRYTNFFAALANVETNFLSQDRYLFEHRRWFVKEMRLRAYAQLLQSYRVVGLESMANSFGVSVTWLDRDLAPFIAAGRLGATIDRVKGVVETRREGGKNKQYQDVVRQGDQLITKLQKYGQVVRLRGSERG
ncbi:proteasome regulatory particle, non-ATPase-like protein [Myriangium duriaei CBS 260.36]|uniref:Proteasome regulatory particle, non-ATPase-like protein n=1 Tax=Myriangium duriaei CBS 260.36 TaxID=1168546 RepID=A0A9P4MDW7_9PEZI|nr:proteasome regulatory particle, non-ATPase-like protein [Myriangium duriaei CBS 260.36]